MTIASRRSEDGFTLIEALVAMAVLALGAVSLLTATEGHTARISALTDRIAARWVAEERLTQLRLGIAAETEGVSRMLNRDWAVRDTFVATSDPDLVRLAVAVAPDDTPGDPMVTLSGYLAAADLPEGAAVGEAPVSTGVTPMADPEGGL